jgi:dTDP-4-amino-4,6-dideoxygalactose transaminase
MAAWRVPLADVALDDEDIAAVAETYRSGWLSMGPRTAAFERAFAAFVGSDVAFAVASGTAALHLICLAAGLGPGDEVIVPSLTFVASVNAVAYTGARPVFADIEAVTEPWLSVEAAEAAITPRTKAILTVAYGGHPGQVSALAQLADRNGLMLLEDAAHAAGGRSLGRHLGTFGLAGAFSFFANKNLAIGEGGAVITDDSGIAERVRLMRSHGMTSLTWDRHAGHATSYDVVPLGFNYRLDEPRAQLAERRLKRLDEENRSRGILDQRYRAALGDVPGIVPTHPPPSGPGETPAHHLFTVVVEDRVDRDAFRAALAERGIQTSVHYPPAHRLALYAGTAPPLPRTEAYAARAVTLPLFAHMTSEQQDLVLDGISQALTSTAVGRPSTIASRARRSANEQR